MLSAAVADLERENAELRGMVAVLKGALAASDIQAPNLGSKALSVLSEQEMALVGVLWRVKPGVLLHGRDIMDLLPSRDHVGERDHHQVASVVRRVRTKLGDDVIESRNSGGYRLSDAFRATLTHV